MTKYFVTLLITLGLSFLASYQLVVEQDIVSSLELKSKKERDAYRFFHEKSGFMKHVFIFDEGLLPPERAKLDEIMTQNLYQKKNLLSFDTEQSQALGDLLGSLSPETIHGHFQADYIDLVVAKAQELAALPGSGLLLTELAQDPFGLKELVLQQMGIAMPSSQKVITFIRTTPLDYEKTAVVFDHLVHLGKKIAFIGGDFFSLSNYQAIYYDINFCIGLSLILNLALFYFFCRQLNLVVLLALGTALSYATGLGLLRIFYAQIYAIALAFSSTFIGFNNEYLVHFSGLKVHEKGSNKIGLGSAIGTTLIGFIVLLFGQSILIRQMAILSIGGLISFIIMMYFFQDRVGEIRFRQIKLPSLYIKGHYLIFATLILFCLLIILPKPSFMTNIEDFSYHNSYLQESVSFFEEKGYSNKLTSAVAVPIQDSLEETWNLHAAKNSAHPMSHYISISQQKENLTHLAHQIAIWTPRLKAKLLAHNLPLKLTPHIAKPLSASDYLLTWNKISPTPVYFAGVSPYLYLSALGTEQSQVVSLAPKLHYNRLLTQAQENMVLLFAIGLLIMFIYLIPWQNRLDKICYIFMPLLLTMLFCLVLFNLLSITVNIIHIMGFSLVIALALDYSAVAISSNFSKQEEGKIMLTGLSALTTFGIIAFARHPVLHDLGLVVSIGTFVSLLFSLLIRTKASHV